MKKKIRFSPVELDTMRFIERYIERKGFAPTLREISDVRGVQKVTVLQRIDNLCEKGALSKVKYKARSIEVLCSVAGVGSGLEECACDKCGGTGVLVTNRRRR